jgi:hypothetical protein
MKMACLLEYYAVKSGRNWPTFVSEVVTASIIRAMSALSTSETSTSIYYTTWRNIPEDSHLQAARLSVWESNQRKASIYHYKTTSRNVNGRTDNPKRNSNPISPELTVQSLLCPNSQAYKFEIFQTSFAGTLISPCRSSLALTRRKEAHSGCLTCFSVCCSATASQHYGPLSLGEKSASFRTATRVRTPCRLCVR